MKKVLAVLMVGFLATSAYGHAVWIAPVNDPANLAGVELANGDTVELGVFFNITSPANLYGGFIEFTGDPAQVDNTTVLAETFGSYGYAYNAGFDSNVGGPLTGAGPNDGSWRMGFEDPGAGQGAIDGYMLVSLTVQGNVGEGETLVNFDDTLTGFSMWGGSAPMDMALEAGAADHMTKCELLNGGDNFSLFGTPLFPDAPGFVITHVPEPASLALLAVGGLALIRRR